MIFSIFYLFCRKWDFNFILLLLIGDGYAERPSGVWKGGKCKRASGFGYLVHHHFGGKRWWAKEGL